MIIVWSSDGALPDQLLGLGLRQPERGPQLAEELLGAGRGARGHLLRALGGLDAGAALVDGAHRASADPLNCTGMLPDRFVLAQRVTHPVLRHQDAREVGVALEGDAEQVEDLALHGLGARVHVEERRHGGVGLGHLRAQADALALGVRHQRDDDLEALGRTPSGRPRSAS